MITSDSGLLFWATLYIYIYPPLTVNRSWHRYWRAPDTDEAGLL